MIEGILAQNGIRQRSCHVLAKSARRLIPEELGGVMDAVIIEVKHVSASIRSRDGNGLDSMMLLPVCNAVIAHLCLVLWRQMQVNGPSRGRVDGALKPHRNLNSKPLWPQAFDCGLLGEGCLHTIGAAMAKGILKMGADIIPCKARVRIRGPLW